VGAYLEKEKGGKIYYLIITNISVYFYLCIIYLYIISVPIWHFRMLKYGTSRNAILALLP
jgi:hypothetical protein